MALRKKTFLDFVWLSRKSPAPLSSTPRPSPPGGVPAPSPRPTLPPLAASPRSHDIRTRRMRRTRASDIVSARSSSTPPPLPYDAGPPTGATMRWTPAPSSSPARPSAPRLRRRPPGPHLYPRFKQWSDFWLNHTPMQIYIWSAGSDRDLRPPGRPIMPQRYVSIPTLIFGCHDFGCHDFCPSRYFGVPSAFCTFFPAARYVS